MKNMWFSLSLIVATFMSLMGCAVDASTESISSSDQQFETQTVSLHPLAPPSGGNSRPGARVGGPDWTCLSVAEDR